jgi:Holliday junction DNA helicase RuvA
MGKKTAQRVLLELKEKVDAQETAGAGGAEDSDLRAQAVAALVNLGYDGASASRAVMAVERADSIEELITQSLRKLAKN